MTLRRGGPSRLYWRRLRTLLNQLPPESRYQTALRNSLSKDDLAELTSDRDPSEDRWSRIEMQLAGLDDLLQLLLIAVISAVGGKPPQFRPNYRPGNPKPAVEAADEKAARRAAMRARFDATNSAPLQG